MSQRLLTYSSLLAASMTRSVSASLKLVDLEVSPRLAQRATRTQETTLFVADREDNAIYSLPANMGTLHKATRSHLQLCVLCQIAISESR